MQKRLFLLLIVVSMTLMTATEAAGSRRRSAAGNLIEVEGVITSLASGQLTIRGRMGDRSARLIPSTVITIDGRGSSVDALQVGLEVEAMLTKEADGTFTARAVDIETDDEIRGIVTSIAPDSVEVDTPRGRIRFALTPSTIFLLHGQRVVFSAIVPGMRVKVESIRGTGDVRRAIVLEVKSETVEIEGVVTAIGPDSITVKQRSGALITVTLNQHAVVRSDGRITTVAAIRVGSRAEIKALRSATGPLVAILVEIEDENELIEIEGEIVSITTDSITVRVRSGDLVTVTLNAGTIIRSDDHHRAITDLRVGDRVEIDALPAGNTLTAIRIEVEDEDDDDRYVEIEGTVKAIAGSSLTIQTENGRTVVVLVTSRTVFRRDDAVMPLSGLKVGDKVEITAARNADGSLEALYVEADEESDDDDGDHLEFEGKVLAVSPTSMTIRTRSGEVTFTINSETVVRNDDRHASAGDLKVGQSVEVKATRTGTTYLAKVIEIEDEDDD